MKTISLLHRLKNMPGAGRPAVRRWLQKWVRRTSPPLAVPCDRRTFRRWAERDPRGWTVLGRFYGAGGQFLGNRFSLSGEDLARGVAVLGRHAIPPVLFPTIADRMRCHHSLAVTDLPDMFQDHVQSVAAVTGHIVLIHNLEDPARSCALNPCGWIEGIDEARALAGILLSRAHKSALANNRQGLQAAGDLLAACILHHRNLVRTWEAQRDLPQLLCELKQSQTPGVADLLAAFRALAARDAKLAGRVARVTMDVGLASWTNAAVRAIGGHDDTFASLSAGLDLAAQLRGVPTVIVLRCPRQESETYGPYLGAILYALAARLARLGAGPLDAHTPITVDSLPVGLILTDWPELGRLDVLFRDAGERIPILAAVRSIAQFDPFYPVRQDVERLLAGMATHIVSAGCDQPTAEVVSRLGSGLIQPGDVTRLAENHAIILASGHNSERAARVVFHGVPASFYNRRDWKLNGDQFKPITVVHRRARVPSVLAAAISQPEPPPGQTMQAEGHSEPPAAQVKRRSPRYEAIERLLADAPEASQRKDKDPWTNES